MRLGNLGAAMSTGDLYGTYVGPAYDQLSLLHVDINKLVADRDDFQTALDAFHAELEILDGKLSKMDTTSSAWTDEFRDYQRRLNEFTTEVSVKTSRQSLGLTLTAGLVAFGTTWAFTKRIPRMQRSIFASAAMLAGGGAAQLWWRNRG